MNGFTSSSDFCEWILHIFLVPVCFFFFFPIFLPNKCSCILASQMVTAGKKKSTVATDFFTVSLYFIICCPINKAFIASDKSSLIHPVNINMFVSWILSLIAIDVQLLWADIQSLQAISCPDWNIVLITTISQRDSMQTCLIKDIKLRNFLLETVILLWKDSLPAHSEQLRLFEAQSSLPIITFTLGKS